MIINLIYLNGLVNFYIRRLMGEKCNFWVIDSYIGKLSIFNDKIKRKKKSKVKREKK